MELRIRDIRKKDYKKAMEFAVTGMHFNLYVENKIWINIYSHYFWYEELNHATQVIAAYAGDELKGVLLAEMKGERPAHQTWRQAAFTKAVDFIQRLVFKGGAGVYEAANQEMLEGYLRENSPDGQILFLAADPDAQAKGIGSALIKELARREKGKQVYLYTDDACTYQFYEHRGFTRAGEKDVLLRFGAKTVPLKCMLYSKTLS